MAAVWCVGCSVLDRMSWPLQGHVANHLQCGQEHIPERWVGLTPEAEHWPECTGRPGHLIPGGSPASHTVGVRPGSHGPGMGQHGAWGHGVEKSRQFTGVPESEEAAGEAQQSSHPSSSRWSPQCGQSRGSHPERAGLDGVAPHRLLAGSVASEG